MPLLLTLLIAKLIQKLSRLIYGGGGALPGLVALKLQPELLSKLAPGFDQIVLVTGTNGKTTATKMIASVLAAEGKKVVVNKTGSNLARGIASGLIEAVSWSGRLPGEIGLFEVDEGAFPQVAAQLNPALVVVLNLFRDQLDRYGELDTTARKIGEALAKLDATVYLNADDPLVTQLSDYLGEGSGPVYFGVDDYPAKRLSEDEAADAQACPVCARPLAYTLNFYGQIGHWRCPDGHIKRPEPQVAIKKVRSGVNSFEVRAWEQLVEVKLSLPGLYNAYNALAALSVLAGLGILLTQAAKQLGESQAAFGRVEHFEFNGRHFYLLLVKNPAGFNQLIQTFLMKEPAPLLIAINDNLADGRDVSWLWDVAFEEVQASGHEVLASGVRASDLALRLKYAAIPAAVEGDLAKAWQRFVRQVPVAGTGYILPTYTAMTSLRKIIGKKVKLGDIWQ